MIEMWHLWLFLGLVCWIMEIFTPGFILGVFGTACLVTAPFAAGDVGFKMQLLVFGVASGVLSFLVRPIVLRHLSRRKRRVATNVDALVGARGQVLEGISSEGGTGRVKVGGEDWSAVTRDEASINAGRSVKVTGVSGSKLIVETISEE